MLGLLFVEFTTSLSAFTFTHFHHTKYSPMHVSLLDTVCVCVSLQSPATFKDCRNSIEMYHIFRNSSSCCISQTSMKCCKHTKKLCCGSAHCCSFESLMVGVFKYNATDAEAGLSCFLCGANPKQRGCEVRSAWSFFHSPCDSS